MKRLIALFALLALLLAACAGKHESTGHATVSTAPSTTETTVPGTETTTEPTQPTTQPEPTTPTTQPEEDPEPVHSCLAQTEDPYVDVDQEEFYVNYQPACCYQDACYRTDHYLMSGSLEVPGQYATISEYQPADEEGRLIRNTDCFYEDDGNTYVVVDAYGVEVLRLYKGAAYITLEEVAAYMYAFGGSSANIPANYTSSKPKNVGNSPWGIYLRGNHSKFSGNTNKYPYEPELPDISGCGGSLQYYEMDIGTTGTDTGNGYAVKIYNDGKNITRGAARLVYTRMDKNHNGIYESNEVYVFYTANHYNDFREYLNYYGGWGQIFGNETGGGILSDKYNCNPTPYVPTAYASFSVMYRED